MSASLSGLVSSINASLGKISARIDTAQSLAEAAMKRPLPEPAKDPEVSQLRTDTLNLQSRITTLEANPAKDPEVAQLRTDLSDALSIIRDLQSRIAILEAKPASVADVAEVSQ
jgi:hypothetical protein